METPDTPPRLDHIPVDRVPRDTLFRLLEPLHVGPDEVGRRGECLLIPGASTLPPPIRILLKETKKRMPGAAHLISNIRGMIVLIPLAEKLQGGAGRAFTSGVTSAAPGPKSNIAPSLVTAEPVMPITSEAGALPKDHPLVLAKNYQSVHSDRTARLLPAEDRDMPPFLENSMTGWFTESLFLRRGLLFTLAEDGERLSLQKWGDKKDTLTIKPDCPLKVCIP